MPNMTAASMMPSPQPFDDLSALWRSLTVASPDARGWEVVCDHLEGLSPLSGDDLRGLEARLARWPDGERLAPLRWLEAAAQGSRVAALSQARTLSLCGDATADLDWLRRLVEGAPDVFTGLLIEGGGVREEALDVLLGAPWAKRLTRLTLRGVALGEREVRALSRSALPALTALTVSGGRLSEAAAGALAEWPSLGGVRWLVLKRCGLDGDGLEVLLEGLSPELEVLDLEGNPLDDDALDALEGRARLRGARVTVSGGGLSEAGLRRWRRGPLGDGEGLSLSGQPLCDGRRRAAQEGPSLIEGLDLSGSGTHHRSLLTWLTLPVARGLRRLSLRSNGLGVKGARVLRDTSGLVPRLGTLDLRGNRLEASALSALSEGRWPRLQRLWLGRNEVGAAGLRWMSEASWCGRLRWLDLSFCGLDREGAEALSRAPLALEGLSLRGNPLGDDALEVLMSAPWFGRLSSLDVGKTGLSATGVVSLSRSPSSLRLRSLSLEGLSEEVEGAILALASSPCLGGLRRLSLDGWALSEGSWRLLVSSPYLDDELRCHCQMLWRRQRALC